MATAYPAALDTATQLPSPGSGDPTNNPSHAGLHDNVSGALIAVETKIGTGSSTASSGQVFRGTGTGISAWGQLVLSTDVANFSSSDLRGVLSDETGSGVAVFGTSPTISAPTINSGGTWSGSPTITTPTIASFTNSQHNHTNSAGGGQLGTSALANASITPNLLATGAATALVATAETTATTSYVDLTTTTDSVTTTIGANGLALVNISSLMSNNTASDSCFMSFAVSGASTVAASDANSIQYGIAATGANSLYKMGIGILLTGLTAGSNTFKVKYKVNGGTGTFTNRQISVIPL